MRITEGVARMPPPESFAGYHSDDDSDQEQDTNIGNKRDYQSNLDDNDTDERKPPAKIISPKVSDALALPNESVGVDDLVQRQVTPQRRLPL
jgi:hypothetical protein